jgi:hypothetical protein
VYRIKKLKTAAKAHRAVELQRKKERKKKKRYNCLHVYDPF